MQFHRKFSSRLLGVLAAVGLAAPALFAADATAQTPAPVGLGTAGSFAVLAGSQVTNTGPSVINGNVGVHPGTAITGFPPGNVNGTFHSADAVSAQAKSDLVGAYNDAAGRTPFAALPPDAGGLVLDSGVYRASSTLGLTGTLTLDAEGDPAAVFIFQVGSQLTTASASSVRLINGAQPCNVFWQIGSSATLGTASVFVGNILALTSISMNDGVTVQGRALARNGAVTLINDTITASNCAAAGGGAGGGGGGAGGGGAGGGGAGGGGAGGGGAGGGGAGGGGAGAGGAGRGGTGGGAGVGSPTTGAPAAGAPAAGSPTAGSPESGSTSGHNGRAALAATSRIVARRLARFGTSRCVPGRFRVTVTGRFIRRVVFSIGGRTIADRSSGPFVALVQPRRGQVQRVIARVTFTDGTRVKTRSMRVRSCAAAATSPSRPPRSPSGFTG